ncbi:MAG: hypothetical protein V3S14_08980 [Anaerolineae bacterium]
MTTQLLTIALPQPVFQYLQEIAAATQQSLEQVALQSLEGNLPPTVADAPPEMQGELLAFRYAPCGRPYSSSLAGRQ